MLCLLDPLGYGLIFAALRVSVNTLRVLGDSSVPRAPLSITLVGALCSSPIPAEVLCLGSALPGWGLISVAILIRILILQPFQTSSGIQVEAAMPPWLLHSAY